MKLTNKYTLRELEALHRKLWTWIEETGYSSKDGWPGWEEHPDIPNLCFACLAAEKIQEIKDPDGERWWCDWCPIKWGKGASDCTDPGSLFLTWGSSNLNGRQGAARSIARRRWNNHGLPADQKELVHV